MPSICWKLSVPPYPRPLPQIYWLRFLAWLSNHGSSDAFSAQHCPQVPPQKCTWLCLSMLQVTLHVHAWACIVAWYLKACPPLVLFIELLFSSFHSPCCNTLSILTNNTIAGTIHHANMPRLLPCDLSLILPCGCSHVTSPWLVFSVDNSQVLLHRYSTKQVIKITNVFQSCLLPSHFGALHSSLTWITS